jgi:predicted Ser/Thr protein kinase
MPETSRFCSSCGASLRNDASASLRETIVMENCPSPVPGSFDEGRFFPGMIVAARYRIFGLIGRGGMGEVYRAHDLKLGQQVGLKFLTEAKPESEAVLARFYNEVRIARQVSHPNVCRVFDIGEANGQPYISMEYVDGEDLGALLRRIGRLPNDKAVEIARKLCAGLAAAHDKGVLHRDLKPANIMLDSRGQVLIMDFGLAGIVSQIQGAEVRHGTPAYMAPEQLAGKEVSVRSDIYALGLVLYELFTGRRAFEAKTLAELVRLREESTPPSPRSLVQELDPAVERVILRCLDSDPEGRPGSALAVAAALPGGDPLAAALAAGEIPSPEIIAAAGAGEGLRPVYALAFLVFILAGLVSYPFINDQASWIGQTPLENSPETLAVRAREIANRLGYGAPQLDRAYGLSFDQDYRRYRQRDKRAEGQAAAIRFWYRSSPQYLVPDRFGSIHELLAAYFGQVEPGAFARLNKLEQAVSCFHSAMWGLVQQGISDLDFDFRGYTDQLFDKVTMQLNDERYPQWMRLTSHG